MTLDWQRRRNNMGRLLANLFSLLSKVLMISAFSFTGLKILNSVKIFIQSVGIHHVFFLLLMFALNTSREVVCSSEIKGDTSMF